MKINSTNNHPLPCLHKTLNGNPPEFICPFCKSNTPLIQDIYIDRNTKSPYLAFKCKCNNKNENAIISLDEYFKAFTEQKLCFKHDNNKAELYCEKCSLYMCETCSNYHSLFKTNHDSYLKKVSSMNIESNNSIVDSFLRNKSKSRTYLFFEQSYNKIVQEYNEYISAENKIINEMILNLNQLQKDIQQNRELVTHNSNQIMFFVKSLYEAYDTSNNNINKSINYEKIVKMQKISAIDNFLFKRDNELINSICQHFNQILKVMLNQQFDMVTRSTVIINKNDLDSNMLSSNRQISTTVEMSENEKIPLGEFSYLEHTKAINSNMEYENSTSEIKQYFNKNYISISPTSSQNLLLDEGDDNINIFSNNPTPSKSSKLSEDIILDKKKSLLDNNTDTDREEELHYLTQNESICTLTEQEGPITSIIQLKNCKDKTMNHQIVTAGNTNYIVFWNPSTLQAISKISSRKGNITVLFELLDGSLAMSYDNCIIKIYALPEKICTSILIGHAKIITSMLQIQPKVFITASKDQSIKFWDTIENNCIYTINEHSKGINCLLYIEQEIFASCGDDSKIIFYEKNKKQFELIGHKGNINTMCKLSPDILASGGEDCDIKLWDFKKKQCIGSLIRNTSSINHILSLIPLVDNQYIALSVSNDGTIILWDVNTRMSIKEIKKAHNSSILVALMAEDNKLYTGGSDGLIKIWT